MPLYDSLGDNAIEYIINHSESTLVFVQVGAERARARGARGTHWRTERRGAALFGVQTQKMGMLAKALPRLASLLKTVVYWGDGDEAAAKVCGSGGAVRACSQPASRGRLLQPAALRHTNLPPPPPPPGPSPAGGQGRWHGRVLV